MAPSAGYASSAAAAPPGHTAAPSEALTPAQVAGLHAAWEHVEPMLARIRAHGRGRDAEPALIFRQEPAPEGS